MWKCSDCTGRTLLVMLYTGAEGGVCGWMSFSTVCQAKSKNSTTENTFNFILALYVHTYPCIIIIYIHSFSSLKHTRTHTQTPNPWHFHCKTITKNNNKKIKKRPQSTFTLTPLSDFPVTVKTPPPPVGTATVNLWHCISLFSTHSRKQARVDKTSYRLYFITAVMCQIQ